MDATTPVGGFIDPTQAWDPTFADKFAVPTGSAVAWGCVWVERVNWRGRPPYYRAIISPLPFPRCPPPNTDPDYALPLTFNVQRYLFTLTIGQMAYYKMTLPAGSYTVTRANFFFSDTTEIRTGANWYTSTVILAESTANPRSFTLGAATEIRIKWQMDKTHGISDMYLKIH